MRNSRIKDAVPALIALILISPLLSLPRPVNISSIPWRVELLASIFLFVLILANRENKPTLAERAADLKPIEYLILIFCAWSAMSMFWASSWTAALHHTAVWANYAVILAASYVWGKRKNGTTQIISTFGLLALIVSALACFDFLTMQDFAVQEGSLRIRYGKFAELAATISPVLFAAAILAKQRGKFVRALVVASMSWLMVMLSLSKGAFIAGTLGFVFLFGALSFFRSDLRRKTLVTACCWLILTIAFQFGLSALTAIPSTSDYISGKQDATRSTSGMRVYTWQVAGGMVAANIYIGVGADNFGLAFNSAREMLAKAYPEKPESAIGEDYVFERAHNEPIQVFAELGLPGILLFASIFAAVGFILIRATYRRGKFLSPLFYGGVGGMLAFGISSLVSSFSFRAFQNGIVFFIVLGLTLALSRTRSSIAPITHNDQKAPFNYWVLGTAFSALLIIFSLAKATSQYVLYAGERTKSPDVAVQYFELASLLDPDNPGAELAAAERYVHEKQWANSVEHFRNAIDRGFGISMIYSHLANAQEMTGDLPAAERTLVEAASIFPLSAFIRARLAIVLEKQGKQTEAIQQLEIGRSFDHRQTNGWYAMVKEGILTAHLKATAEPGLYAAPPELLPENAVAAYNTDKVRIAEPK